MAQLNVTLTPNPAGPQPVGTSITWTANVSGDPDPNPVYEYRFSAESAGAPVLVRKGFGHSNTLVWTPNASEGDFHDRDDGKERARGHACLYKHFVHPNLCDW